MSRQKKEKTTTIPVRDGRNEDIEADMGAQEMEDDVMADDVNNLDDTSGGASAEELEAEIHQTEEDLLTALKEECNCLNDKYLRATAEFDNYKKRLDRQWADFKRYAHESLVKELLPIVDNLERAVLAAEQSGETEGLVEGVSMTLKEILKVLEQFHVTQIQAVGEPFDPKFHQAVAKQKTEDADDNVVLEEYQKGYLIHDRLLRPSMVVVAEADKEEAD